jgi:serine/threonine protein kinase
MEPLLPPDPEPTDAPPTPLRSPNKHEHEECRTLRFKLISKHPNFPHNKLLTITVTDSLDQLQDKISKLTHIEAGAFALLWEDADRYPFALNAPGDWEEALSYFTEHRATLNLKLYVTDPSQPPGTPAIPGAGPSALPSCLATATRPGFPHCAFTPDPGPPSLEPPDGPSHSPSAFAAPHAHPHWACAATGPQEDQPIGEGCDSFVTSSTATIAFGAGEAESMFPEALTSHFMAQPSQHLLNSSFAPSSIMHQSFSQPCGNLSFCSVMERGPTSPLCGPTDCNGQRMVWRRGRVLGKGAYGTVYLGLDQNSGQLLAVKQVCFDDEQCAPTQETYARLRALAQEIRTMESLQHPNIVRYLGTDRTDNGMYIFMEYIPGGSIASLLKQFGPFQEQLTASYVRQILQGLGYLHSQHVLHRDVKGANILVSQKGQIKLADFGSSKSLQDIVQSSTLKQTFVGTAEWMAPEAITCRNQTKAADIWSVGCTVLEMTYADTPWSRTMEERRTGIAALYYIASSQERPKLPHDIFSEEACDFLHHCLQRDPVRRPTALELLQHSWLQTQSPASSGPGTPATPMLPMPPRALPDPSPHLETPSSPVRLMPTGPLYEDAENRNRWAALSLY